MIRKLEIDTDLQYSVGDSWGFEENFKILQYSGHRTSSISLYIDYGNLSEEYDIDQDCMIEDTRENRVKIQWYLTREGYERVSEVEGNLDDLIRDRDIGNGYDDIQELYDLLDYLSISYTSNYLRMSTRGYSQGDYAEILVNKKEFKEIVGSEFKEEDHQKWFDHYFWDSPIYGEIGVRFEYTRNGVNIVVDDTFDFREFTTDEYDVDGLDIDGIIRTLKVPYPLFPDEIVELKDALGKIDYIDVKYPCSC